MKDHPRSWKKHLIEADWNTDAGSDVSDDEFSRDYFNTGDTYKEKINRIDNLTWKLDPRNKKQVKEALNQWIEKAGESSDEEPDPQKDAESLNVEVDQSKTISGKILPYHGDNGYESGLTLQSRISPQQQQMDLEEHPTVLMN